MKLIHNISSAYFNAANKLASKKTPRRIIAYVESYDDVFFWRTILSQVEDENHYYEVLLPTQRGKIGRGKKCVLKMIRSGRLGQDMIACVDADYDYVTQRYTEHSRQMLDTPFVYHTFAYAIENWQCWAPSLHQVAVMVTLNDKHIFDYKAYINEYSRIIFPLFLWSVWLYRHDAHHDMTVSNMDRLTIPGHFSIDDPIRGLKNVAHNVEVKTNDLQRKHPEFTQLERKKLIAELSELGVNADECYLFIHGHHLFEKVVTPMLTSVCNRLRRMRENEIRMQSLHQTQLNTELAGYTHATEAVASMLKKNTMWLAAPLVKRIIENLTNHA